MVAGGRKGGWVVVKRERGGKKVERRVIFKRPISIADGHVTVLTRVVETCAFNPTRCT
jgi:hypothetical protein